MKYLSICSGIEAASVAWHPLGWEPIAFSEIEPFPSAVLAHHWPDVPNLGDMTKHHEWPTTIRPDLIVGGTPCQAFSVAGLRQGLADPRGNLTLVFLAILAQYRPQWVVWENVPGVLSDKTGAFGAFLGGLGELGYGFAYRVLDAQYAGVAQRRRRVFVVAHLGDWRRAAAVLFERDSLQGNPPPSREAGQGITYDVAPCLAASGRGFERTGDTRGQDCLIPSVSPAVTSKWAKGSGGPAGDECQNLVATTQYGPVAGSLTARHDSSPCADRGQNVVAFSCKDHGADAGEIAPTLRSMSADQSHANGGGQVAVAFGVAESPEVAHCLRSGASKADKHESTTYLATPYAVRRLTPTECERLQGFPDGHSMIPWRNKPADQCPDGPRYKALGNSMAVPVMAWIGKRIQLINDICNSKLN